MVIAAVSQLARYSMITPAGRILAAFEVFQNFQDLH